MTTRAHPRRLDFTTPASSSDLPAGRAMPPGVFGVHRPAVGAKADGAPPMPDQGVGGTPAFRSDDRAANVAGNAACRDVVAGGDAGPLAGPPRRAARTPGPCGRPSAWRRMGTGASSNARGTADAARASRCGRFPIRLFGIPNSPPHTRRHRTFAVVRGGTRSRLNAWPTSDSDARNRLFSGVNPLHSSFSIGERGVAHEAAVTAPRVASADASIRVECLHAANGRFSLPSHGRPAPIGSRSGHDHEGSCIW